MEILFGASFVAAFIAGIAALFAPCCITVLLPAYLGSIFRQRRTVFLMTFIFFLGLLVVFLPLGLGFAGLGQLLSQYHDMIFTAGGILLLYLGTYILLGRHFSMPFSMPQTKVQSAGSVFTLGIFSGFATLCCAPVLAGVLALSVLPGSVFWGGIYSIAYVLGMVFPLFIMAYYLDKKDFTKKFMAFKKQFSYTLAGKSIKLTLADIVSGATFLFMGILILFLAFTNRLAMSSGYQATINIYLANLTSSISQYLGQVPIAAMAVAVLAMLALVIRAAVIKWRRVQ